MIPGPSRIHAMPFDQLDRERQLLGGQVTLPGALAVQSRPRCPYTRPMSTWYAWEGSGGRVHEAYPTDANLHPSRAMTLCGERVDRDKGWELSQTKPARGECTSCHSNGGFNDEPPRRFVYTLVLIAGHLRKFGPVISNPGWKHLLNKRWHELSPTDLNRQTLERGRHGAPCLLPVMPTLSQAKVLTTRRPQWAWVVARLS